MSLRIRLLDEVMKQYENDIYFTVTTNYCLMEVVEPRGEEMEPMSCEVENDLLIEYATSLPASSVDKKKKRLGTYKEECHRQNPMTRKQIRRRK